MRYGHLNFRSLGDLRSKSLVAGLSKLNENKMSYESCLRRKHNTFYFDLNMPKISNVTFKFVHFDICGPFEVPSLVGSKHFILLFMSTLKCLGYIPSNM